MLSIGNMLIDRDLWHLNEKSLKRLYCCQDQSFRLSPLTIESLLLLGFTSIYGLSANEHMLKHKAADSIWMRCMQAVMERCMNCLF